MTTSNGSTTGVASDAAIDSLYSFWPGTVPAPAPCPEALFSLTLKGTLAGQDALLTVRGQTAAAFRANLEAMRGLLDAPQVPAPPARPEGWCATVGPPLPTIIEAIPIKCRLFEFFHVRILFEGADAELLVVTVGALALYPCDDVSRAKVVNSSVLL